MQTDQKRSAQVLVPAALPLLGAGLLVGVAVVLQPSTPVSIAILGLEVALGGISLYSLWPKNR